MCFQFWDKLTLVGVTTKIEFCVSGKFVRCKAA